MSKYQSAIKMQNSAVVPVLNNILPAIDSMNYFPSSEQEKSSKITANIYLFYTDSYLRNILDNALTSDQMQRKKVNFQIFITEN